MKMKKVRIAFIALSLGMMGFLYAPAPAQTTNPPEEEEATNPDDVSGNMTSWKENAIVIKYDTEISGGFEIFGIEVPFGFNVEVGVNAIGTMGICQWAFADCDTSKNTFTPFP